MGGNRILPFFGGSCQPFGGLNTYICKTPRILLRLIKRVLFFSFITVAILLLAGTVSTYLYQDKIIQHLVREANKNINTPIHVGEIDISIWEEFPLIAVSFKDVVVGESYKVNPGVLAKAQYVYFAFNAIDLLQDNYIIKRVIIDGGEINLEKNSIGEINYNIVDKSERSEGIELDLDKIKIINTKFSYSNLVNNQELSLQLKDIRSTIKLIKDYYSFNIKGDLVSERIGFGKDNYLENKDVKITSRITFNNHDKLLKVESSNLNINHGSFSVTGDYMIGRPDSINISIAGTNSDIHTILSLFPNRFEDKFSEYTSEGDVYFSANLSGPLSKLQSPAITVEFGFDNTLLINKKLNARIKEATFDGYFKSSELSDLSKAELHIKNINGKFDDKEFSGSLLLENFLDPYLEFDLVGNFEIDKLFEFYPVQEISQSKGLINLSLNFEGKIADLQKSANKDKIKISGEIGMNNIDLVLSKNQLPIYSLNGNLLFNNHDIALDQVSGRLSDSDFLLNGFFRNMINFALFENQPIGIEAKLSSDYLDLDQILSGNYGAAVTSEEYSFSISPNLFLNFDCDVKFLKFRRLKARNIKGTLKVKEQLALGKDFTAHAMGGDVKISGMVNARNANDIQVDTEAELDGINIDSLFFVFENFNQNFLVDKNLKGQIYASISTEMSFNNKLVLNSERLISDVTVSIKNGELNDFEPMKMLAKYVSDESDLARLKFSELNNDIHIENKVIFLPQMEVSSNITTINLSGTHTFNQDIDYRVIAPLKRKKISDKDEAFGAIEDDGAGGAKIYLRIKGTTTDYKVTYDIQEVRKKIIADLKNEVKELKTAFRDKGKKKKKVVELNSDEYFDWDNKKKN